jgi:hypothetical protein
MSFNRNIITEKDIERLLAPGPNPKTLTSDPPAFTSVRLVAPATPAAGGTAGAAGMAAAPAAGPGAVAVPAEDGYLTKLLKYVPVEVLGTYLFMAGVINANVTSQHDRRVWLGGLLIGILVLTIPYDWQVLGIARLTQVGMSVLGVAVYVFALGGWFATTSWYHQWYASLAVPLFAYLAAVLKLPALPDEAPAAKPARPAERPAKPAEPAEKPAKAGRDRAAAADPGAAPGKKPGGRGPGPGAPAT